MSDGARVAQLRDSIGPREPISLPAAVARSFHNLSTIAETTFEHLDLFRPDRLPERVLFSRTDVLARWRTGGQIPEELHPEFKSWLEAATRRSNAIEENKRKLRATMWAEVTMRAIKPDFAEQFAEFHRHYWRVARVNDDCAEREQQITDAIKYL